MAETSVPNFLPGANFKAGVNGAKAVEEKAAPKAAARKK